MLCLDTYALSEISQNNPDYEKIYDMDFVIAEPTLAEFYYVLLRDHNEQIADLWLDKFRSFIRPVPFSIWAKAMKYKHENNKENLSFFDCVGYIFAIENGYSFVTGDKQFAKRKGVMYIK